MDLLELIKKSVAKWYYFAICVPLTVVLAGVYIYFSTPLYKITASLLVKEDAPLMSNLLASLDSPIARKSSLQSEIGRLRSYYLVRQTVEALGFQVSYFMKKGLTKTELYKDSPFTVEFDSCGEQTRSLALSVNLRSKEHFAINGNDQTADGAYKNDDLNYGTWHERNGMRFRLTLKEGIELTPAITDATYLFVINDLDHVAREWQSASSVLQFDKQASVIQINVLGAVPQKTIDFTNMLLHLYLQQNITQKNDLYANAIRFIDEQIQQYAGFSPHSAVEIADTCKPQNKINGQTATPSPSATMGKRAFERQFKSDDGIYHFLFQKRAEVEISQSISQPDQEIVDQAHVSHRVAPSTKSLLSIAFILGFLLPSAYLFLRHNEDRKTAEKKH